MAALNDDDGDEKKSQSKKYILQGSMTEVRAENGRLFKVLPAIEAATEYIGDYVYYNLLLHHLPDYMQKEYLHILENKNNKLGLHIGQTTKYDVFPQVAKPAYVEKGAGKYEPNKKELTKPPIQIPMEYSRPLYEADNYSPTRITKDVFTVRNVEEVAVLAWLDYLLMNDDRFSLFNTKKVENTKNVMLISKSRSTGRFVYLPIDQGFCRQLTAAWYHWLPIASTRYASWPKYPKPYKQLIYSKQWIEHGNDKTPPAKIWMKNYKKWIKNQNKAKNFVDANHKYFPNDAALRQTAAEIIGIYWNVNGVELCADIGILVRNVFDQFNKNNPNIPELIQQAETKWKQKHDAAGKKNKKKKKDTNDKLGYIRDYNKQWKKVQNLIAKQIKQCAKFKPVSGDDADKKMKAIKEAAKADKLLKDFTFQQLQNLNDDEKHAEQERRKSVSKSIGNVQDLLDELIAASDSSDHDQQSKHVHGVPVFTGASGSTHLAKQLESNEYYDVNYYDELNGPYYQENEYEYVLHPGSAQTLFTMEVILMFAFLVFIYVGCIVIGAFIGMVAASIISFKKKPETIQINDEESQF